jgi:predicted NBD/HSP70 family sugar kinase
MNILVIDVGGTNVKLLATGQTEPLRIPSGLEMTPERMLDKVLEASAGWSYDRVSIGYPGPVMEGRIVRDPYNLAPGWVSFDFEEHFKKPVKLINDAAMQALGSYEGGRMLFLGLGTGLGSALVVERVIAPMELAHLHYKKGLTFEDYAGRRGLERLGKKRWRRAVADIVARLQEALVVKDVVLGGGNVKKLKQLPPGTRRGDNDNAFKGGFRLWEDYRHG